MEKTIKTFMMAIMILAGSLGSVANAYKAKATSYYPANNKMEGGFFDRRGRRLYTLQAYLNGKAPYVSVAMDSKAFAYGTKLQIPELDRHFAKQIEFRVVDTGRKFRGKGKSRIDICTQNRKTSLHDIVNGTVTLVPLQ